MKRKKKTAYREVKILKSLDYESYLPRLYKAIETPNIIYLITTNMNIIVKLIQKTAY